MQRQISKPLEILLSGLLAGGALFIGFILIQPFSSGLFRVPAPAPSISYVVTGTLDYGDAIKTYESVATSAIHASEQALEAIKWIFATVFLGLTAVAVSLISSVYRALEETREKALKAEAAAQAARDDANNARQQLELLSDRYNKLSQQFLDLASKTVSLDAALQAVERGEISREELIELQQQYSWLKWTHIGDETGRLELLEDARDEDGLMPVVRATIEAELKRIEQKASIVGGRTDKEAEFEGQLRYLLSVKPVGKPKVSG